MNEEAFLKHQGDDEDIEIELEDEVYYDDDENEQDAQSEVTADTSNRSEKSLGTLTKRFIKFLQDSPVGLVDINSAADKLNVSQKRRIYDITNVLEGIGMIEKKSKNIILWKGGQLRKPGGEIDLKPSEEVKLHDIKTELTELEREERLLDTHLRWIKQSMRNVCEDQDIYKFAYVFKDEAIGAFENDKLILIQAPPGTDLHVGQPTMETDEIKYHLSVKSHSGPAIISSIDDELEETSVMLSRPSKPKRARTDLHQTDVPSDILEHEEAADYHRDIEMTEALQPGPIRALSPPPSEIDYTYGQSRGETLSELYDTDLC